MANIALEIARIESASRGEEVRDSIIAALTKINTQGVGNATSFGGWPVSHFATKQDIEDCKFKTDVITIYPDDWQSSGDYYIYSFESKYPGSKYHLWVEPGPATDKRKLAVYALAMLVSGSETQNILKVLGTKPVYDIQLALMVMKR